MSDKQNRAVIGAFLKGLRLGGAEQQIDLSKKIGIKQTLMSRLERGLSPLKFSDAVKYIDHFDIVHMEMHEYGMMTESEYDSLVHQRQSLLDIFDELASLKSFLFDLGNNAFLSPDIKKQIATILKGYINENN